MIDTADTGLENYKVKASDREYQFWERNPLSIDLWSRPVFLQKLNYMHKNPTQAHWKLCTFPKGISTRRAGFMSLEIRSLIFYPIMKGSSDEV